MAVPGNQLHPSDGLIDTVSVIAVRQVVISVDALIEETTPQSFSGQ